jgi:hypothetical protein
MTVELVVTVGLQAATSLVVTEAAAPITVVVSISDTISRIEVPLLCTASGDGSLGGHDTQEHLGLCQHR